MKLVTMKFVRIGELALAFAALALVIGLGRPLAAQTTAQTPLAIVDEPLPPFEAGVDFHAILHASGGVPPYVWSPVDGDLPDGINLSPEGLLSGRPTKNGTFTFTLKVEDSGHPSHSITKEFRAVVTAALLLEWNQPPKVRDNRIDGVIQVSNSSRDIFDLTVVIVAVAENGRATAIGYEHFPLKPGTTNFQIPFGNTLPHGGYVIHADAIAEIAARNAILRQRLQTPQPLQVAVGP
ncbi:MAG TPA: Ig domain-containing protein [Terriglobales bacterium]|nr:Ig domain-containing protein [Terriglobales bacterium]